MGNDTFESVVKKLADLDVQYLNLHREWRKEKALREQYEKALKDIEFEIDNSDMGTAVYNIIKIIKG